MCVPPACGALPYVCTPNHERILRMHLQFTHQAGHAAAFFVDSTMPSKHGAPVQMKHSCSQRNLGTSIGLLVPGELSANEGLSATE